MGGGIGMGNTCKPMAVSFQCMTKFTTNKKKKRFPENSEVFAIFSCSCQIQVHDCTVPFTGEIYVLLSGRQKGELFSYQLFLK